MVTKVDIINALSDVKNAVINYSLTDLGIIKDVAFENGMANVLSKVPFPDMLIKDIRINASAIPILAMDVKFEYEIQLMNEEEKQHFLTMETKGWRF